MRKIKYIGFYDCKKNYNEKRNYVLSATNKMDYIAHAISQNQSFVQFISPSWTYNSKYYKGKKINISNNIELILSPTLPWGNKIIKVLSILYSNLWLLFYLLIKTKKQELVIVYHSLWLAYPVYIAKKIKKLKLILEVEEIYNDVKKYPKLIEKIERKIIDCSCGYIFCTELLNQKINKQNKPYSIIYGTYNVEDEFNCKFDDDRIHVVYAGTFDPRKGGAINAVSAAEYLDENYHIHIIGFGSEKEKSDLKELIKTVSKKTKCKVTYDGLYKGEEYIRFLQKCDIGLSTQTPDAEYNDTSFPSKVLSYMCNGLRVVSVRIKALERSEISELLYYYDENTPECIANAIKYIKIEDQYNSRSIMKELDRKFTKDIEYLLN